MNLKEIKKKEEKKKILDEEFVSTYKSPFFVSFFQKKKEKEKRNSWCKSFCYFAQKKSDRRYQDLDFKMTIN